MDMEEQLDQSTMDADEAAEAAAEAAAEQERKRGRWYVVHTLSGHENKVKETIEQQHRQQEADLPIYEVLIPVEKVSEVRQGRKTTTTRKYFPGYILVRMDLYLEDGKLNERAWYFIRETQGVIGFIGGGDRPMPLPQHEVDALLRQATGREERAKPKINFAVGEAVRVRDGAFENFEGTIEDIDAERGKLKILVSIFGRSTPVELEFWQVERT
jgi:transcriptional antiterminator NusG